MRRLERGYIRERFDGSADSAVWMRIFCSHIGECPEFFHTACGKSELLPWSQYRLQLSQNLSTVETEKKEKI